MASTSHVWLITGCSAGFGISIARTVLAHGHRVIASSRNPSKTPELVEEIARLALKTVEKAQAIYGRLDVLVNNAGFAVLSALENVDEITVKAEFETNVLVSSKSQRLCYQSCETHAKELLSTSASLELSSFGIRVLLVEPGAFRTNFLGHGAVSYQSPSEPYMGTAVEKTMQYLQAEHGTQPGDPRKAAERIYEVVMGEGMAHNRKQYLRLVLGNKAYDTAQLKVDQLRENFCALEDISKSTDYS
ncbi:short chain oxidoreductase/dehydrogenase [Penicillium nucicola]|uniref:short chain oxidoreductase/dehydrogenase n=1 Tax=Penicillium nucicola TaxID=1850975 RepID=UPI0025457BC8|nr:short chain oxidoreductase/dehydrogenase [Penicillium nucicola]KAJ5742389.1 short chain oxidoreductase/dehydrogenase [Penicillium nucicola]